MGVLFYIADFIATLNDPTYDVFAVGLAISYAIYIQIQANDRIDKLEKKIEQNSKN
jgi:hypothetical protein